MEAIKTWFTAFGQQSKILLKKNWTLLIRNKRATILQMVVPFIFVLFLWLLQFGLEENSKRNEIFQNVEVTKAAAIREIPRCLLGEDKDFCLSLIYTTNSPDADLAMASLIADSGLPADEIRKFDSMALMDAFLDENKNTTNAAVSLNVSYSAEGTKSWRFNIQYNQTVIYDENLAPVEASYYLIVPIQLRLQRAILRVESGNPSLQFDINMIPFPHPELLTVDVVRDNGPPFFFGALMFNFVIQLGQLVTEKELGLRDYMSLMGLKSSVFWFTWWATNTIMNTISVFVLIIGALIFQFNFFLLNDFRSYFVLFWLFGIAMVPLAFVVSTIVKSSRTATSLGFVIFLIGILLQGFVGLAFSEDFYGSVRFLFQLLPFALLAKGITDLSAVSDNENDDGFKWSDRADNAFFSMNDVYLWLFLDFLLFLVLTWYLDNVMPNSHGVQKKPWFFLTPSYWIGPRKSSADKKKKSNKVQVGESEEHIDEDVKAERDKVLSGNLPENTAVVVTNMVKTYGATKYCCIPDKKKSFTAVNGTCFTIDSGSLFCLLGHNGAGKTTSINMMTGMFGPTSGDAVIFGHSIHDEMDKIRKIMGVCPQHDVLWDQLTGEEHLEMFAALKGLSRDALKKEVSERLKDVELTDVGKLVTSGYSGGMKRRLSTAIALTADPQIVFLDEPTTGMDPVSRRQVWNLIERVKRGRVIVLTTHSMEEADVLGDKIVIMKKGSVECIGSSLRLKNKFGAGYRITALVPKKDHDAVIEFIQNEIQQKPASAGDTFLEYNIGRELVPQLPKFFQHLEERQEELHIDDIQLSMTTLEEVFLSVAGLYEFDD